jgi:calcyphosin
MTEMNVALSETDMRLLFSFFDRDGNGKVDFEELLRGVRDEMNPRRRSLVELAFHKLDSDGSGEISPEEISKRYDASKHPEVLAGEVFRTVSVVEGQKRFVCTG